MDSNHSIWNASKQPVMSNEGNPLCPRKQAVMSTGGKLLCPTGCERVSRQPSMSYRFRTFSTKKCVPSESRQPLEIKGSGGFQNGLMFQPHPESTSFTSMGERIPPPPVADEGRRSSNEQRLVANGSAARSLLRIVTVGSSPTVTT